MSQSWMIVTALAVPVSFVVSRYARNQRTLQQAAIVGLWVAYLSSHQRNEDAFFSVDTMVLSVLVFILPLKLSHLILCYQSEGSDQPIWKDFLGFLGSFAYYAIPISKSTDPPPTWSEILHRNLEYLLVVAAKIALCPVVDAYARQLVATYPNYSILDAVYWKLLASFSSSIILSTFSMDLNCVVVSLLSGGRYQMLPMHNYPLLSTSVAELWAKRYNGLIHCLLKETIYVPLRQSRYSASVASFAAFAVSGILHSWVAYFTFGGGILRALLFFLVQVPWIALCEPSMKAYPTIVRRFLTVAFFFGTLPLYAGLFVEAMPQWLENNVPQVPELPLLTQASQWSMVLAGIDPKYAR